jgi:hypothetical protein
MSNTSNLNSPPLPFSFIPLLPSALLFLLRIALAIQDLPCFYMNFRIESSLSVRNDTGTLNP